MTTVPDPAAAPGPATRDNAGIQSRTAVYPGRADPHAPRALGTPPRVLLISSAGTDLAMQLAPAAASVHLRPLYQVLTLPPVEVDVVVLLSPTPLRDLAALNRPLPPIVLVTAGLTAAEIVVALRAGARSLLVEGQFSRADLAEALRATAAGQSRLSPDALSALVRHVQQDRSPGSAPRKPLSQREREIMELVAAGAANGDIAGQLHLAEKTVRNQISRIYLKLQVRTRTEAIVRWLGT